YPSAPARERFAASMAANSSLRALYGPLFGDSIGGLTAWRMTAFGAALTGLMSILLVVRHICAEEEDGRLELVGAGAVGRRARLAVADRLGGAAAAVRRGPLVGARLRGRHGRRTGRHRVHAGRPPRPGRGPAAAAARPGRWRPRSPYGTCARGAAAARHALRV